MSTTSLASFDYLERLPGTTFKKLYQQPSTALAIFRRMLPSLAKSFVMGMLYMTKPLLLADLESWVQPGSKREKEQALSLLSRLHIVTNSSVARGDPPALTLTKYFSASLRLALTGGGNHQSFGVPSESSEDDGVDTAFLDTYARSQWESILHYVVNSVAEGSQQGGKGPTENVKQLLATGGLVDRRSKHSGIAITQSGFSFLLQEVNAQVWTLLLLWIENAAKMDLDSVDVLSFLFMLASLDLGRAYSTITLTETQQSMVPQLVDFGLVYVPTSPPPRFYPTRLSTTLTSDASALRSVSAGFDDALRTPAGGAATKGFIIIETNYRLYAYTSSPLQIAVLALFARLSTRYPNMVAGRVTRDSIRRAIDHGITSDQIISYLTTHAHPQMRRHATILPPTVVDQIRLWQIENERMKATPGFLFRDFASAAEYESTCRYADEIGVLVWQSDPKRMFFVTRHEQLRDFIKSRKMK